MSKYVLASVGSFFMYDKSNGQLLLTSKSLTDSSISFNVTENSIKGGMLNQVLGSYFTDAEMEFNLVDALFSMEAVAMNTGSDISAQGETFKINHKTTVVETNKIPVDGTPKKLCSDMSDIYVWIKKVGEDDWVAKVPVYDSTNDCYYVSETCEIGDTYCVKSLQEDLTVEEITVSSSFIPKQVYGVLELPLFKCTETGAVSTSSSQVGTIQVTIPTLQLKGAMELSLTASGNATTPLTAKALATYDDSDCCGTSTGYYAKLTKIIEGASVWDNVEKLVVVADNTELEVGETTEITIYAINKNGATKIVPIGTDGLTITNGTSSKASLNGSIVTGISAGTTKITASVTASGYTGISSDNILITVA